MKTQHTDAAKAILRRKFIAVNVYLFFKRFQINNLIFYLNELEKEEQTESKQQNYRNNIEWKNRI